MCIEATTSLINQGTHHLGTLPPGFSLLTFKNILLRALDKFPLPRFIKFTKTLPEIGPFGISMMEKIGITAVIRAAVTAEIQTAPPHHNSMPSPHRFYASLR